jgi:DNA repair protein RecO (recombination protein O)
VANRTTEALVLRSVEFGESDLIVHLLMPDAGRLTAIAKGARRSLRRFPGTLDLFNHLRVQVAQRRSAGLARLEQATLIEPFTSCAASRPASRSAATCSSCSIGWRPRAARVRTCAGCSGSRSRRCTP